MASTSGAGGQFGTMIVTFMLILIPMAILNANIARRKGRSAAKFGWLSVIPFVGYFMAFYLISLTDKVLMDKVDEILQRLQNAEQPEKPE